jgi:hypothetical protein
MDDKIISLTEKRAEKQRADFADSVAEELGVTTEGMAAMVGTTTDEVREGFLEALERQAMYRDIEERVAEREKSAGRDPDECNNAVCPHHVQHEHEHIAEEDGLITYSGRSNYCDRTPGNPQGCRFRMKDPPLCDQFGTIPSHAECARVLQRIGYLREDEFGGEVGTDFMFHQNTKKLWIAFVKLLVETRRVTPEKDIEDWFSASNEQAKAYYKEHYLPDTVGTVGELIAQRNALLAFIRGELDWPSGRCPCGEDVHWNGVAHTPNCRFKPTEEDDVAE